jgi:hypothetical protein
LPSILALDLHRVSARQSNEQAEYALVSPSHSAVRVIQQTVPLICKHTVGKWEIIFVLDSSYDESLQVLHDTLLSPPCLLSPGLMRARILVQPSAVYETSSDNLGLTISNPSHFYLEIQSDMFLMEHGWNRDLVRPVFEYNDIFAVGGRCGHSRGNGEYYVGRCGADVEHLDEMKRNETEDAFYVAATTNRGPIAFRADALQELGFFDEVNFWQGDDDHDLNRRAIHRGWFPGYKYAHFYAPLNLSPQRNEQLTAKMTNEAKLQEKLYSDFRRELKNHSCDANIPFDSFAPANPGHATKRSLHPLPKGFDPYAPLPDLPALITRRKMVEKEHGRTNN